MTFDDLPDDWPDRPLTDPALVTDVLDLVVMDRDRRAGSLCLLLCDDRARLLQPVAISEPDELLSEHDRDQGLTTVIGALGRGGAVLVALARADGLSIRDDDVRWRASCERVCSAVGVRLLGVHVVTCDGSREVPADLAAA
jgi:hypothetical protein